MQNLVQYARDMTFMRARGVNEIWYSFSMCDNWWGKDFSNTIVKWDTEKLLKPKKA